MDQPLSWKGLSVADELQLIEGGRIYIADHQDTRTEDWSVTPISGHWYEAAAKFAIHYLGAGHGRSCLVIGSPIFEANYLFQNGWNITYLDVRQPPRGSFIYVRGDVSRLPFDDQVFDAVSTTCVLCHVGLGRYGDPEAEAGDRQALREIARVMKPGASATIMFGPYCPSLSCTVVWGNVHRMYCLQDALMMSQDAGLQTKMTGIWMTWYGGGKWLDEEGVRKYNEYGKISKEVPYCYLCAFLEKPA